MRRILNIGSCNLDDVYTVAHFVQAGETLSPVSVRHFPGGKGLNQSVALAKAGGTVYHAGRIGTDGLMLQHVLQEAGVHTDFLDCSAEETGRAIIQVDPSGQNCILLSAGANHQIGKAFIDHTLASFGEEDVLILQNEISNVAYAMEAASKKGLQIAFNPSPITPELLAYPLHLVKWFILNEIEGSALTGASLPEAIIAHMQIHYPQATIVQTIGEEGVLCHEGNQQYIHGIYKVDVADTTAAGDTFTGFFLSAVVDGKPIAEALRLASMASAIAVSRPGAAASIPSLQEVEKAKLCLVE